ncbi:uncharacterized protein PS065_019528 isoform 2-T4 [Dugong dugon]
MSTCYRVKCDKLRQPESQAAARGTHSFPHSCGIRTRRPPGSRRYTRTPGLRDPGQYTLRLTPPLAQGKLRHRDASDRSSTSSHCLLSASNTNSEGTTTNLRTS